jgi:hypothetical protein
MLFKGGNHFKSGLEKGMLEGMSRYTGQHLATAEGFGFQLEEKYPSLSYKKN